MTTHPKITDALQSAFGSIRLWRENDRDARLMGVDTLAGIREYVRAELDEVREQVRKSAQPVEFRLPTYEDHHAAFFCAAQAAYLSGASKAQVSYLAKLATDAAEMTTFSGRLTKAAASALINDYLKG